MERHDIYCYECETLIYSSMFDWTTKHHHFCQQEIDNFTLIKKVFPRVKFTIVFKNSKVSYIYLDTEGLLEEYMKKLFNHIRVFLEKGSLILLTDGTAEKLRVDSIELESNDFFDYFSFHDGIFRRNRNKGNGRYLKKLSPLTGEIIWHEIDKEDEYYAKASLIKHERLNKNGRAIIYQYNICPKCAEALNHTCKLCDSNLKLSSHF